MFKQEMRMSAKAQKSTTDISEQVAKALAIVLFAYILIRACMEFYAIAWGTGVWLGEFSPKWGIGFFAFVLFCILNWVGTVLALWKPSVFGGLPERIVSFRQQIKAFRWLLVIVLLVFPVWLLQYTPWGVVFSGLYFRLLLWIYVAYGMAVFLQADMRFASWYNLLAALLLTSSAFSVAFALINVSDYPFSIGWSEGNRIWDYSLYFGRYLYDYPVGEDIFATTDAGRQLGGGLPFIIPGVTILFERLWVSLTTIIPYLLLGLAAFRFTVKDRKLWFLLGFWAFIFLKQGPIHPRLVLCAFVIGLTWRKPLWLAVPLVFITSYLAEESRYTWLFAPGMWIVMLEFSGAVLQKDRLQKSTWWRAIILGLSGALGGYYGPTIVNWVQALFSDGTPADLAGAGAISVSSVTSSVTTHPLLWYRLFPNATYGIGIILALLIAVAPTVLFLIYLSSTR